MNLFGKIFGMVSDIVAGVAAKFSRGCDRLIGNRTRREIY